MLHLTRKPGQEVWLNVGGVNIVVRILRTNRTVVDLGIIAPLEVVILRPDAKVQEPKRPRVPMDNSPGNPTPVAPAAKVVDRVLPVKCAQCEGTGWIMCPICDADRVDCDECKVCDGTGSVECDVCGGFGAVDVED